MLVSDPVIAEAKLLAPDVVYVVGRSVGRTTVSVLNDGRQVAEWDLVVTLDYSELRDALSGDPMFSNIVLNPLARGVLLSGSVPSIEASARALRVVSSMLSEHIAVEKFHDDFHSAAGEP